MDISINSADYSKVRHDSTWDKSLQDFNRFVVILSMFLPFVEPDGTRTVFLPQLIVYVDKRHSFALVVVSGKVEDDRSSMIEADHALVLLCPY